MSVVPKSTPSTYETFAGFCAVLVGIAGLVYAISFFTLVVPQKSPELGGLITSVSLMAIGLLSTAVLVALFLRLRETESGFSLLALVLGIGGALGTLVHGGFDLANTLNPPEDLVAGLSSEIDPRGLLTFAISGAALIIFAWLIWRSGQFPKGLAYLGGTSAVLLIILYLGRLLVLDPKNPVIVVPALLNGFLIGPGWYIWLGLALLGSRKTLNGLQEKRS
jgi:hypothetical protein